MKFRKLFIDRIVYDSDYDDHVPLWRKMLRHPSYYVIKDEWLIKAIRRRADDDARNNKENVIVDISSP